MKVNLTVDDKLRLTDAIVAVAREAGSVIMMHYQAGTAVRLKEDASPVTAADDAADRLIGERLAAAAPHIAVISEEAFAGGRRPDIDDLFFLVDPLDGTKEFLGGNGEFTVNIALIENGVPVLGVVYAPAISRLFYANGLGQAFERRGDGPDTPIRARRPPPGGLVVVASRSHRDSETDAYLSTLNIASLTSAGSSLKFCLIASGEADLYPRFGPTMEWDTAAGHAVLAAAGGCVTQVDGAPFTYGKSASGFKNPAFVARGYAR